MIEKNNLSFDSIWYEKCNILNSLIFQKVSSGDFDNRLLIDQLKKFKKPIILSTGMSDILDIKNT